MIAKLTIAGQEHAFALDRGVSLAIATDFQTVGPHHFGAPLAASQPLAVGAFTGEVATGASANCRTISLTPHCTGTHTETVAHLLRAPGDAWRVIPKTLLPAALITVAPEPARETRESTVPAPWGTDNLITERRLRAAFMRNRPFEPRALIIRTLPNDPAKHSTNATETVPPYFTQEAAHWLVAQDFQHVVLDIPSFDRMQDEGKLTGHRIFFGLPATSRDQADVARPSCTITELAYVPDEVVDGNYALLLAVPAIGGDAVPSQPVVYPYCK